MYAAHRKWSSIHHFHFIMSSSASATSFFNITKQDKTTDVVSAECSKYKHSELNETEVTKSYSCAFPLHKTILYDVNNSQKTESHQYVDSFSSCQAKSLASALWLTLPLVLEWCYVRTAMIWHAGRSVSVSDKGSIISQQGDWVTQSYCNLLYRHSPLDPNPLLRAVDFCFYCCVVCLDTICVSYGRVGKLQTLYFLQYAYLFWSSLNCNFLKCSINSIPTPMLLGDEVVTCGPLSIQLAD